VIAAKASPDQEERYLRPIAAGTHITTLSLSEPGTGSFFYLPQTRFQRNAQGFTVQGEKHFVTNGGYADSYVVSGTDHSAAGAGEFSMLLVDRDRPGLQWLDAWEGLGMRGNASRRLQLQDAPVPAANLLGEEGDQVWFVFEVVAPYFLMGMSGTYVGVAQALLDETLADVSARRYPELGQGLSELPGVQDAVADLWMQVQRARGLLYQAAQLGDWGTPEALLKILAAKVEATETAVRVADSVMRLGGGRAYRENGRRARLLRDALAGRVMAPTTELLKSWLGRSLLGLPWF
ncbi:MAG TPA: acyl-CoA dehydrogenase, partial [Acidiferrobacteraceae bacterium]|nr:acyl-CoA dehydrogenase [Acidiferrobacteraceae bacterium]